MSDLEIVLNGGLCLPEQPYKMMQWGKSVVPKVKEFMTRERDEKNPIILEIFTALGNLSNNILANAAAKTLSKLRLDFPEIFAENRIFNTVNQMLGQYPYRLAARRFIYELFESE